MYKFRKSAVCAVAALIMLGHATIGAETPKPNPTSTPRTDSAPATPLAPSSTRDAVLGNPQVGDVYAAELTAFSRYTFGSGAKPMNYGLLKVVRIQRDRVTVITASTGHPNRRGATNALYDDVDRMRWDNGERIAIQRADFPQLVASGRIFDAIRPDAERPAPSQESMASLDAVMRSPELGDVYGAELTAFSATTFGADQNGGGAMPHAYGLLRVVQIFPDRVIVVTENEGQNTADGIQQRLRGYLGSVGWDEEERIPIFREQFATLIREHKLIGSVRSGDSGNRRR